jgi:hypothetical protein
MTSSGGRGKVAVVARTITAAVIAAAALGGIVVGAAVSGCSGKLKPLDDSADASTPAVGTIGGDCYANYTCDPGLTCNGGHCYAVPTPEPFDGSYPFPDYDGGYPPPPPDYDGGGFPNTLYERLGERPGIAAMVKETVEGSGGLTSDPQILSYFAIRTGGPGGAPSLAVVEDCFTQFIAKASGGPEPYPYTSVFGGGTFVCRDMGQAHAGLGVTSSAFQHFVTIMAGKISALGVSQADLQSLGGALLGTAADIVDQKRVFLQTEAGVDASFNYGARCTDVPQGTQGCTDP